MERKNVFLELAESLEKISRELETAVKQKREAAELMKRNAARARELNQDLIATRDNLRAANEMLARAADALSRIKPATGLKSGTDTKDGLMVAAVVPCGESSKIVAVKYSETPTSVVLVVPPTDPAWSELAAAIARDKKERGEGQGSGEN